MVKSCPGCGAKSVPEARFCRSCGTPLRAAGVSASGPPVSPLAQTAPLAGEGRPTDGLSTDDSRPNASDTKRVGREEIEQILRRVQADYAGLDERKKTTTPDTIETNAPQNTMRLAPDAITTTQTSGASLAPVISAPASAQELPFAPVVHLPSAPTVHQRRVWPVVLVAFLCLALAAGAWALIHSRRASASDRASADTTPGASTSSTNEQNQPAGEKADEAPAQPATEQTAHPETSPVVETSPAVVAKNMEHPRVTRAEQQANAPETNVPKAAEPSVTPAPRVAQPPAPKTNTAQTDADAYYFMGLNMLNGREPKKLSDGELTAALNYFLRAQGGAHGAEARKYADRLGKEFDRRRRR